MAWRSSHWFACLLLTVLGCEPDYAPFESPTNPATPTYWRDIAPLLAARCLACHDHGGVGPVPLTTFAEARAVAALIAAETGARRMPPWLPSTASCAPLEDSRALTAADVGVLADWAAAGAPEGERVLPYVELAPQGDPAWRPDFTYRLPAPYVPSYARGDDYRCFVIDPQLATTRDLVAMRVTPSNRRVAHHINLTEIRAESVGDLAALEAADAAPGYNCAVDEPDVTAHARAPTADDIFPGTVQFLASWSPGLADLRFPAGTAVRLAAGSQLVLQVHYRVLAGTPAELADQPTVELFYAPSRVATQGYWLVHATEAIDIPAGARPDDPQATVSVDVPAMPGVRVLGFTPHMHYFGHSYGAELVRASGERQCLIDVPRWNPYWQESYWFSAPQRVAPTGDAFHLRCTYDNTAANQPLVGGVPQVPRELTWGTQATNEMCVGMLFVAADGAP